MSYRHNKRHKAIKGATGMEMWRRGARDMRFCRRWGIPEERAYLWARSPIDPPAGIMQLLTKKG